MTPEGVVHRSGWLLIAGGVCFALFLLIHPYGHVAGPHAADDWKWVPAHSFHFLGALFTLFGLVGLYLDQWAGAGKLGFVGFVLAFIGTAMFAGTGMITAFVWPVIADYAPGFVEEGGPMWEDPLTSGATLATYVFLILGYVVLGVALLRARSLPAPACWVTVVGVVLFSVPVEPVGPIPWSVRFSGAIVFGAGLAWLGWALTQRQGRLDPALDAILRPDTAGP